MHTHARIPQLSLRNHALTVICIFSVVVLSTLELSSQQLQKGVSVELAPTTNARPAPDADQGNAWIVSISADGRLWFGIIPVTSGALANKMIQTPRNRDQNLYIKADARASYSYLVQVLKAAHVVGFESPVLLTSQQASAQPEGLMPPMGFEVWIAHGTLPGHNPVEVEIAMNQGSPAIRVNAQQVSWENLADAIKQMSNQPDTIVRLTADGEVPFGQVARAIDAARASGAKVVLAIPSI